MKDLYAIFNIPYNASLLEITKAYLNLCLKEPTSIFYYTKIFKILACPFYKMIYDSLFWQIDVRFIFFLYRPLNGEEEHELAQVILLVDYFKDLVYDSKFFYQHPEYLKRLDDWYNELVYILDYLKEEIQSFYLN